jgi:hypothetical protein
MGKTVPSYRMALEMEIDGWRGFRKALDDRGREAFDELMDMCRSFASPSGNATNPVVFEPMVMSIILAQGEKIRELEYNLNEVLWQKTCAQDNGQKLLDKPEIESKP